MNRARMALYCLVCVLVLWAALSLMRQTFQDRLRQEADHRAEIILEDRDRVVYDE